MDTADLSLLLLDFGACAGCASDLDGSGEVDSADTSVLLLDFGNCPSWYTVLEETPNASVVYDATLRAAITATNLPWRVRDNGTGIEMVLIPPGDFLMEGRTGVLRVTMTRAFYIGRTEVTQEQWVATMGNNPSYFQSASPEVPASEVPNRPVESVSWNDTQLFCEATGMRLPWEAEWEYAYNACIPGGFHSWLDSSGEIVCRYGWNENFALGWLDDVDAEGNCELSPGKCQTHPVGGKAANGFGLFDMVGNVWEWCQDWRGYWYIDYVDSITPSEAPGARDGDRKVVRGGAYYCLGLDARAGYRGHGEPPGSRYSSHGFRVARTP